MTPEVRPPTESVLRDSVRRHLVSGALFRTHAAVWAGRPGGHDCFVCGNAIVEKQVEYEVPGGPNGNVYTHVRCWAIWREESRLT